MRLTYVFTRQPNILFDFQNAIQNEVALELSKVTSDIDVNDVKYGPGYDEYDPRDGDGDIGVDDYYYYDHDGEDIEQLAR